MKSLKKTLFTLTLASMVAVSCAPALPPEQVAATQTAQAVSVQATQTALEAQKKAEQLAQYNSADGLASYTVDFVDIKIEKVDQLNPFNNFGNSAKAEHVVFPVSHGYYDAHKDGEELQNHFNGANVILEGEFTSYVVSIAEKKSDVKYCLIKNSGCEEISKEAFDGLLQLNALNKMFVPAENGVLKPGAASIDRLFTDTCDTIIESAKQDYSTNIWEHVASAENHLFHEIQMPRYVCDQLKVGDTYQNHFLPRTLIFSRTPSGIIYRVKDLTRNYSP